MARRAENNGGHRRVVPRSEQRVWDCEECEWQGHLHETDAGVCPECGGEITDELNDLDNYDAPHPTEGSTP